MRFYSQSKLDLTPRNESKTNVSRPSNVQLITTQPASARNMSPEKSVRSQTPEQCEVEEIIPVSPPKVESGKTSRMSSTTGRSTRRSSSNLSRSGELKMDSSRLEGEEADRAESAAKNEGLTPASSASRLPTPAPLPVVEYHTVKFNDGQHVEDITRHLLNYLPSVEEVSLGLMFFNFTLFSVST